MPGDENKTTTTSNSTPWKEAQPTLKTALAGANTVYKDPNAFSAYTNSNVVPFASETQAGMGNIEDQANAAMSSGVLNNPMNFLSGLYGQGGLSADQRGVANQWRNTASGAELLNQSPEFENVLQRVLGDAGTGVNLGVSGAGRYGSGAHTDVLGRTLGGISSEARLGEYGRQLGRMDAARGNLASLGQQGVTNLFGAGEAMPGAWQTGQMPATDLMKIGAMSEDLTARTLADQERIFREKQGALRSPVEWLSAIGSGAGSLGGTQSQTTQMPSPNPFLQIGAGVLGMNSLLNNPLAGLFR